jgi:hypothetical protein
MVVKVVPAGSQRGRYTESSRVIAAPVNILIIARSNLA